MKISKETLLKMFAVMGEQRYSVCSHNAFRLLPLIREKIKAGEATWEIDQKSKSPWSGENDFMSETSTCTYAENLSIGVTGVDKLRVKVIPSGSHDRDRYFHITIDWTQFESLANSVERAFDLHVIKIQEKLDEEREEKRKEIECKQIAKNLLK